MTKPSLHDSPLRVYAGPVNSIPDAQPRSRRGITLGLAGLAVAASLMLSGCFALPSLPGGGSDGSGVSGGSDGSQSDSGPDDVPEQFQGMPITFPSDIPLIPGEVVFGIDVGTGWSVLVSVDDLEGDFVDATDRLKGAGYEVLLETVAPEGSFGAFENESYQIQVSSQDTPDYGLVVNYLVVRI